MTDQITYLTNAFETTLSSEAGSTDSTITVASVSGLTAPCYLVVEPDSGTQREYMLVTNIASLVLTVTRYLAGSAAGSGLTHPISSVVRMAPVAQHIEDLNDRVTAVSAAAVTDHGALTGLDPDDDHTQYHTDARAVTWHTALSGSHVTNGDSHDHVGGDGAQIDHGGLAGLADDDHTSYHTDARAVTWHDADDHSAVDDFLSFGKTGVLKVETGTIEWPAPFAMTLQDVRVRVATAPTGASLIVDVNKNGTTIFTTQSNRPTVTAGSNADVSGTPDVTSLVAGDYLSVDIDQIGSTVAGSDLVAVVRYRRA